MAEQQEAPQLSPEEALAAEYDVGDRGETPASPITPEISSDVPQEPVVTPAPPSVPTHPRWLLNMALDQGFSDDEIREIPTDQLGEMVHRIHANVRRVSEQRQQAEGVEQSRRPQQQQVQQQREPTIEDEIDLGDPERDGFTPEMVALLKRATAIPLARVKQLEAQLGQLMQYQQNKEAEARFQLIDRVIEGFGPQYVKHFGKGNGQRVKATDPQAFQKRLKLVKIAASILDEHGGLEPAMQEAVKLFPIDQESPQQPQESDVPQAPAQTQQQAWNQGGIAKPTQRQPVHEPPGRERAIKNVSRTLAAQGVGNADGSTNENGKATRDDFLD